MSKIGFIFILALSLNSLFARTNDSDLAPVTGTFKDFPTTDFFSPDEIKYEDLAPNQIGIKVILKRTGNLQKEDEIVISSIATELWIAGKLYNLSPEQTTLEVGKCEENQDLVVRGSTVLTHSHFQVQNHKRDTYEILTNKIKCGKMNYLIFNEGSFGWEAFMVWTQALKVYTKLASINRTGFWNKKITIVWPGGGNFYDFDRVFVQEGYEWDVVTHEIGHALYDMAQIGLSGTGEHFIDRCYSDRLALSEGWPTFFAGFINLDLKDRDAYLEYMVPRRAPLSLENVPEDVCQGTGNEWRVFAFLWDLIDLNEDNENLNLSYATLWDMSLNKRLKSIKEFKDLLLKSGYDPVLVNVVWQQNLFNFPKF